MDTKEAATPMWQLDFGDLIVYNTFKKICRSLRQNTRGAAYTVKWKYEEGIPMG